MKELENKKSAAYGCIVILLAAILALAVFLFYPCGSTHVTTINIDERHSIIISAEDCWEISQGLEYQVPESSISVNFGSTIESPDDLKFIAIKAENSNLVAIVEATNPDVVMILHDFKNGNSWPYHRHAGEHQGADSKGESMLGRVKEEYPNKKLILSSEVQGNRSLKISY